ncbi:MAG: TetR/AcrR family transcriptional regulator [Actinomycetaceae bacterium]|nr:TetR/AcrR family transcriptional regulator [Actinomycetaceae bacterium]
MAIKKSDVTPASNRSVKTQWKIIDSFLELAQDIPIENLTVSQLCTKAKVHRSTFYAYFRELYDVRDRCEDKIFDIMVNALEPIFIQV